MKLVSKLRLIYYDFLKLKTISGIIKRFSGKEKHTARHVAAPGSAMCPADVSMMSARGPPNADVIMTSVLTWSMLTKSTGPCVSGVSWAHVSAALCR